MKIRLHEIKDSGLFIQGSEAGDLLELEDAPEIASVGDIEYDLRAQIASDELIVSGSVSAELEFECARCGVFFSTICGDSAFLRAYRIEERSDLIEIGNDLREAVLLGMPHFPHCSEECEGLCPKCGKNRNYESCECGNGGGDIRWTALDELDV